MYGSVPTKEHRVSLCSRWRNRRYLDFQGADVRFCHCPPSVGGGQAQANHGTVNHLQRLNEGVGPRGVRTSGTITVYKCDENETRSERSVASVTQSLGPPVNKCASLSRRGGVVALQKSRVSVATTEGFPALETWV